METEKPAGTQVITWLDSAKTHVQEYLRKGEESVPPVLFDDVIRCISRLHTQIPLSYSFTALSHLISLQHAPCVSLLGWSTEQYQKWCQEGVKRVGSPPSPDNFLPRTRLLLLGYISDHPMENNKRHDGNLYLKDSSGCIPCEIPHLDLSLLGALVFFPCWSYIPPKSGRQDSEVGYLEILSPPVPILCHPTREVPSDPVAANVLTPTTALLLLKNRSHSRQTSVSITGEVCRVTSLLNIRQKTYFFFFLEDQDNSVPVVVQVPCKLSWYHALYVGDTYEVTVLSICSVHGSSPKIFSVTSSSQLISLPANCPPYPVSHDSEMAEISSSPTIKKGENKVENWPQERQKQDIKKESKTLTYKGVLTKILDPCAGLYELDGELVLCTAYLQLPNRGRGLREGATVEVFDAHLQQSPSPLFPPLVLACCLRSRVHISEFSRLSSSHSPVVAASNLHLHLLFRYQLRLPEYLWVSDVVEKLREKLYPYLVTQRCLVGPLGSGPPGLAENLLSQTLSSLYLPGGSHERNPQGEILDVLHDCPLRKYSPLPSPWSLPSLSLLSSLVSENRFLRSSELNRRLHWSYNVLQPEDLPTPPRLLGVLHTSSSGVLKLKDQMFSLPCLILPRPPIAWIGCVIKVSEYELIMEKVENKVKEKIEYKTYVLFLCQNVQVLHQPHICSSCTDKASCVPRPSKCPRTCVPWVSRLFVIGRVEGRGPRSSSEGGLQFQAQATWVGGPQLLEAKYNYEDGELKTEEDKPLNRVLLLFSGSSVRWFNFLQPNRLYRLIATGETNLGIFDRQSESSLQISNCMECFTVHSEWTLQDVENPEILLFPIEEILCIKEALKKSSPGSLLSVTGTVSHRSICDAQSTYMQHSRRTISDFFPQGISLKLTLMEIASHSEVSVYIDLSRGPYPLGLLPGVTLLLQGLEWKVSRSGSIYLRSVSTCCVCVLSTPTKSSEHLPPPPIVLFKNLPGPMTLRRAVCSVSCVLNLTLRWVCSMCGDIFRKGACARSPSCSSKSGVFQAKARVKADDGSSEVVLELQDDAVSLMLGMSPGFWEALQRRVLSRGEVTMQYRGRNHEVLTEEQSEDTLLRYVTYLTSRSSVSRPLLLTFTLRRNNTESLSAALPQSRRFTRGDRDYITYVPSAPTLTCLHLQEVDPRTFCHLIHDRNLSNVT
ncbi:CST complex subunit CTC1 isoform X2 [Bombina bombina]|uniref:CST complex subunit CTC1 isoform X2 n=1 Tax=Bombina bombina TaxID=8345 RepID=UPI00235A4B88|nr:CST complex subunit CTC1 isoform X2 [Bombina bombina]